MAKPIELCFAASPADQGCRLQDFLRKNGVSATLIKAVKKEAGGFWADDSPIRTCDSVQAGKKIRFCLPPEPPTTVTPQNLPIQIAYESKHVIVLEKPAGMAVHPTLNYKDGTLANAYMGLLAQRGDAGVFRPVNRIDKDTSGLVLCAKNTWSAALLSQSVQKEYLAVVEGVLLGKGVIAAPIGRAPGSIILRRVCPEGKPSRTEYTAQTGNNAFTLVRAVPVTGRTHQLRVHFAHLGHPLAGDELYGGSRGQIGRHALHCAVMHFEEPEEKQTVRVESPLPEDMQRLLHPAREILK